MADSKEKPKGYKPSKDVKGYQDLPPMTMTIDSSLAVHTGPWRTFRPVIDPEMQDEMRVTVVATGLGNAMAKARPEVVAPVRLVNSDVVEPGPADFSEMDRPTVIRRDSTAAKAYVEAAQDRDMDYLDIPAFLRRQAD